MFPPGVRSQNVLVAITSDTAPSRMRFFHVCLVHADRATIETGRGTGRIMNDDADPTAPLAQPVFWIGPATAVERESLDSSSLFVWIDDVTLREGDQGVTSFVFTVSLSAPPSEPITVDYHTADGTARAGHDYGQNWGQVLFDPNLPGSMSQTIVIDVLGDEQPEPDETFFVHLDYASGGVTIADGYGIGTILDDDTPPTVVIEDAVVVEGNGGATAVLTVALSEPAAEQVVVFFATADGTARLLEDYLPAASQLVFPAGSQYQPLFLSIQSDSDLESDEVFYVDLLEATGATIARGRAAVTILDDDGPTLSIDGVRAYEGAGADAWFTFTVTLSQPSPATVFVDYSTADGTALAGPDYSFASDTLSFAPGETSAEISIRVLDDPFTEPDEIFFVNLLQATGATILNGRAAGIIVDAGPEVSVGDVAILESDSGETAFAEFTVSLSEPAIGAILVGYATSDGTAHDGEDYEAASGQLEFLPGEQHKTI